MNRLQLLAAWLGMYAFFLAMLAGKVRRTPRPVKPWLKKLPTFVFLLITGQLAITPPFVALVHWAKSRNPGPAVVLNGGMWLYCLCVALWFAACIFIVRWLFAQGAPLCDARVAARSGAVQKVAYWLFGIGDRPRIQMGDEENRLQGMDLLK